MDQIRQTNAEEEKIEDLREVVDLEDEQEEELEDESPAAQLYFRVLSNKERRKMEKAQAKAEKDAEKERKRVETEALKAEKGKEKADKKMKAIVAKLRPMEVSASAE